MRYIVDSRYFKGVFVASMSDDLHSDYGNETLEELRVRKRNPHLIVVTPERGNLLIKRYQNALQTPFKEITEERYWDLLNCMPPARMRDTFFFVGEPYYENLNPFCFTSEGLFFMSERNIHLTDEEIYRQIREHMEIVNLRPVLVKGTPFQRANGWYGEVATYVSYSFEIEGKLYFIQNLVTGTGSPYDDRSNRRKLAEILRNLRKNHYRYYTFYSEKRDIFDFFDWIRNNSYTLEVYGELLHLNREEGFVDFSGNVVEYSAAFRFRIYSRELLEHIIHQLRTVKRRHIW